MNRKLNIVRDGYETPGNQKEKKLHETTDEAILSAIFPAMDWRVNGEEILCVLDLVV